MPPDMLRISPSIVDSYEYMLSVDDDDLAAAKLAELVAQIKGEPREPSEAMLLGTAFHAALELPSAPVVEVEERGTLYRFDGPSLDSVRANQPAGLIRELEGVLQLNGVVMHLRVDG